MRALILACAVLGAQEAIGPHLEPVPWTAVPELRIEDPEALREALSRSLTWLNGPGGTRECAAWGGEAFRQRLIRSLEALTDLSERAPADLRRELEQRFSAHRLKGEAGDGALRFTGYCEGWAEGSRTRTAQYRFPLYRKPKDFSRWKQPHPTRQELEGREGTGSTRLKGEELVWLKDRFAAYLFHVQGSGRVKLAEGGELVLGYAGRTAHPFAAVGELLAKDFDAAGKAMPPSGPYATLRNSPALMDSYLPRNPRFVFFSEQPEAPPKGAYGMGLTGNHSVAADSTSVPPGAALLLSGGFGTRLVLNQDRGGAIQGPGRLDIYAGGGPEGTARAGACSGPGQAFLLLVD